MDNRLVANRYERQSSIIGLSNQQSIQNSHVLIVGVGGLGCPSSLYLTQAGIGKITLVDSDIIETSNLHRQVLFTEKDIGEPKAKVARRELSVRNSSTQIISIQDKLTKTNAQQLIQDPDIILDCTDNFETRYLLNEYSRELKKPLVSASIYHDDGFVSTFNLNGGHCLKCVFPSLPPPNMIPNCSELGVLGIDVGIIGLIQAKEAINVILGNSKLNGKILTASLETLQLKVRDSNIRTCLCPQNKSTHNSGHKSFKNIDYAQLQELARSNMAVQLIDIRDLASHNNNNIGGINIPLQNIELIDGIINKSTPIVVYCKTGRTSLSVAQYLIEKGFIAVYNLNGGVDSISL